MPVIILYAICLTLRTSVTVPPRFGFILCYPVCGVDRRCSRDNMRYDMYLESRILEIDL